MQEHHLHLQQLATRFAEFRVYVKPSKTNCYVSEVQHLGYLLNGQTLRVLPSRNLHILHPGACSRVLQSVETIFSRNSSRASTRHSHELTSSKSRALLGKSISKEIGKGPVVSKFAGSFSIPENDVLCKFLAPNLLAAFDYVSLFFVLKHQREKEHLQHVFWKVVTIMTS